MADIPFRLDPNTPYPDVLALLNQALDAIDGENRTKVISNTGIPQILFGYQKGGFGGLDYGLKVSKIDPATGKPFDVTKATDDQLYFSSAFDVFKVIKTGTLILSACPPSSQITDSVNLGPISATVPAFDAYLNNVTSFIKLPYYAITGAAPYVLSAYQPNSSLSGGNVFFNVTTINNDAVFTIASSTVRYYLFQETAN